MKKFLTIVLSLFFLLSLFLAVLFVSLENTFLQPNFHAENFKKINLYQRAGTEIIPALVLNQGQGDLPMDQTGPIPPENFGEIIQQSLPTNWLQQQVEEKLTNIFGYLKGKKSDLELTIELSPLKKSLAEGFADFDQEMSGQISGLTRNMPDRLDLTNQIPSDVWNQFQKVRRGYQVFRYLQWALVSLTAIYFLALVLVNKENLLGYFKNLTIVLLIFSTLKFGLGKLVGSNILGVLPKMPASESPALDVVRNDLIAVTLGSFLDYLTTIYLGIMIICGAFLGFLILKNTFRQDTAV